MVCHFWHQFPTQFLLLFQMLPCQFILLCMVAHSTITWLVETIPTANQRALCHGSSCLGEKEERYHLKELWKLDRNWYQTWHTATHRKQTVSWKLSVSVCELLYLVDFVAEVFSEIPVPDYWMVRNLVLVVSRAAWPLEGRRLQVWPSAVGKKDFDLYIFFPKYFLWCYVLNQKRTWNTCSSNRNTLLTFICKFQFRF